ncbi:MAG: hydroxymethylbilane synthase [Acidimicrobiales bacterium]
MSGVRSGQKTLRLATRGSPLALVQARIVSELLVTCWGGRVDTELVVVETAGDKDQHVPIHAVGGEGVFVKEVDAAVIAGRAELAVHSAKDLPSSLAGEPTGQVEQLDILAVLARADPRDALVGRSLSELGAGARVATGSVRRRAQLAWLRPDLTFAELRGNMATRLAKVPEGGAIVVAMAALERLGLADRASEVLSVTTMLPQVGQGVIAICARRDDEELAALLGPLEDHRARVAVEAERAYLGAIGGGCDMPVGAYATLGEDASLELQAMIASPDGHTMVRETAVGTDPHEVGSRLARRILEECGGRALLEGSWTGGGA